MPNFSAMEAIEDIQDLLYTIAESSLKKHPCWIGFGSNRMVFIPDPKRDRDFVRTVVSSIFGMYEVTHIVEINKMVLDLEGKGEVSCIGAYFWSTKEQVIYALDGERLLKIDPSPNKVYDSIPNTQAIEGWMGTTDPVDVYRSIKQKLDNLKGWALPTGEGMQKFYDLIWVSRKEW